MSALKPAQLPSHFLVPFLGLLILLLLGGYELLLPADRILWLLVGAATIAGAYLKPAAAAAIGWVLVLLLGAYLAVDSALSTLSGASWLTLLVVPWLPAFASSVVDFVKSNQARLDRQRELIEAESPLHPVTNLPGMPLATQFLPMLNANVQRLNHTGVLVQVQIMNLDVLRTLTSPEELAELLEGMHDAIRSSLRGSDWLFQISDDTMLIFADLGRARYLSPETHALIDKLQQDAPLDATTQAGDPSVQNPELDNTGHAKQVLLDKIGAALRTVKQLDLSLRILPLQTELPPLQMLLHELSAQSAQPVSQLAPTRPTVTPVPPARS